MKNLKQRSSFIGEQKIKEENIMGESLIVKLSKAVSFAYKEDATSPGVVVSHLKNGQVYVSVVRYSTKFAKGKQVVCNAYANDIDTALSKVSETFLSKVVIPPTNPLEDLRASVKK
jgi:hypothetical protein